MTADQLQSIIRAGLHCEHLSVEGDGSHWYATMGTRIDTNEVHALSMKTYTPEEWASKAV